MNSLSLDEIKQHLNIEYEISLDDLYNQIFNLRNKYHTDLHNNASEELKGLANEKFIELSSYLEVVKKELNNNKIQLYKNQEIIQHSHTDENNTSKITQILLLEEENKTLKLLLSEKASEIIELKSKLKQLEIEELKSSQQELVKLYKPTKNQWLSLGLTFLFATVIALITKVSEISTVIGKYYPYNPQNMRTITFIVIIIIIVIAVKKYLVEYFVLSLSKQVQTTPFIKKFFLSIESEEKYVLHFTEEKVFNFLKDSLLIYRNKFITYLFLSKNDILIEQLKNIFIYNLITRQLVEIDTPYKLDRKFKVVRSY